ncbi:MAG: hypothetical protein OK457_00395 [Thaumarchaeota archaeon]|nr:hypothetical protein [Nitrososphaerota archaeon]
MSKNESFAEGKSVPRRTNRTSSQVQEVTPSKRIRKKKTFVSAKTRAPVRSNPEIPILCVLAKSPTLGQHTKVVLKVVESKWFKELTETDLKAVYPESKKKIVETIIKFSRKNLVVKGEIHPLGEETFGTWRATPKGIERALKEGGGWVPKYVDVDSMIVAEEDEETP